MMPRLVNNQENISETTIRWCPHPSDWQHLKNLVIPREGKQLDLLLSGSVKWHNHSREQFGNNWSNWRSALFSCCVYSFVCVCVCILDGLAFGLPDWGETTPPRVNQFLVIAKGSKHTFHSKVTNPEPLLWTTSFIWLLYSRKQYSSALITQD